jgi:transcriptional regulator with XRE-family HTH domain
MSIYRTRKRHGLSQPKLGRIMGVSRQTIARWEAGDRMSRTAEIVLELIETGELPQRYWR